MAFLTGQAAFGYPSFDGCTGSLSDSDFKLEHLATRNDGILEPLKMAFDMDENNNVFIYFIQRRGTISLYNPVTDKVSMLGKIPFIGDMGTVVVEDGLVGIALDPGFKTNKWLYLFYSWEEAFRVSRFTLINDSLNMGSEKIILKILSGRARWHTGGAMQFDDYGDLWISVGDNESMENGPANTADLRGGILRIRPIPFPDTQTPTPGAGATYTIPKGNMWEHGAEYFSSINENTIASQYRDPAQMRREIYAKGTRNSYTLSLDPVRRWAAFGDCGPDYSTGGEYDVNDSANMSEEHTIITKPSFMGWPYWSGWNYTQPNTAEYYDEPNESFWGAKDPLKPENKNAHAQGVDRLLPYTGATHAYRHSCAMTGPIYRYNGALSTGVKLPPHFDRYWFVTDSNLGWIRALKLNNEGTKVESSELVFSSLKSSNEQVITQPLDFQAGPDGALYVVNYSCKAWYTTDACAGIFKISYTGSCQAPDIVPEKTGCTDERYGEYDSTVSFHDSSACITKTIGAYVETEKSGFSMRDSKINVTLEGEHTLQILDLQGRVVYSKTSKGPREYSVTGLVNRGIYVLRIRSQQREFLQKLLY
ncbi:MAG: PQQ-dependent sugar dehydrogenase [Fibrobacteria bacterium]|nr:PQQ-dependent sugar dehydrogenase [Fibrobacteria bacterium]